MNTPIYDFVKNYTESGYSRLHMPGHKGTGILGCEKYDLTEICGADVLSEACGIIAESENNASALFGSAHSFYITEGSTAAICAMLALVKRTDGKRTLILAARNVHKAFIHACALLDLDTAFIMPESFSGILSCKVTPDTVEQKILECETKPDALYLTSPDYLGTLQDIKGISEVLRKYNIPLLVDNAHGAYLKFLESPLHPMDLGADICCDSAHKTLPVLTGGAYLHISKNAPKEYLAEARGKIALFTSTSPSYLILESLDLANKYLNESFKKDLSECIRKTDELKEYITEKGFTVAKSEPLKITIECDGEALSRHLRKHKIEPEYVGTDCLVLMLTPQNTATDFERLKQAFSCHSLPLEGKVSPKVADEVSYPTPPTKLSIRNAIFSPSEEVDTDSAEGRICAAPTVSCPPAVPIAISGEEITKETIALLKHYGINKIKVIK